MAESEKIKNVMTKSSLTNKIKLLDKDNNPLKGKEGNELITNQTLAVDPFTPHYFEFSDEKLKEDGSFEKRELFSIDKKDDSYTISFADLSLFKTSDGKSLADILGKDPLLIKPGQGGISISKKHGATCFQITATSGKTYTISTDATSIKIADEDGIEFSHMSNIQNGKGIDVTLNTRAVEAFFDKNNETFQTYNYTSKKSYSAPKAFNDFPFNNLALYAMSFHGNNVKNVGDYTFMTIDPVNKTDKELEKNNPFTFVSMKDPKDNTKTNNFFLINGKFEKFEKMELQYEIVNGKPVPRIVIQVVPQFAKKDTPSRRNYAFDLKMDGDKLSAESEKSISILSEFAGYQIKKELSGEDKNIGGIIFEKKDNRDYATFTYKLKPENYSLTLNLNDENINDPDKIPPEVDADIVDEDGKSNFAFPNNPGDEDPDSPPEETTDDDDGKDADNPEDETGKPAPTDEEQKDVKPEEKTEEPEIAPAETKNKKDDKIIKSTKARDFKKFAEDYGTAFAIFGFFLAAGLILTGLGPLAIAALVLVTAGSGMVAFKDKAVIKSFDIAYNRLKEREQEEAEADDFAENFLAREKDLDKANIAMLNSEKQLDDFLALTSDNENSFRNIYEKYGVGFSQGLEDEHEGYPRNELLMSREGYEIKKNMLNSLQAIQRETKSDKRNELINNFISQNFREIPKEKKEEFIKSSFTNEYLTDFVKYLDSSVSQELNFNSIISKQEESISQASEIKLSKLFNTHSLDDESRKKLINRYSVAIVKRLSGDKEINETKLDLIFKNIPDEEKVEIYDALIGANTKINTTLQKIDGIAKENRENINSLKQMGHFMNAIDLLEQDESKDKGKQKYETYQNATNSIKDLIVNKTLLNHKQKTLEDFSSKLNDTELGNNTKQLLKDFETDTSKVEDAYSKLISHIMDNYGDLLSSPLEKNLPVGSIIPELNNKDILNLKAGTIDSLVSYLQNETADRATELKEIYLNFQKEKTEFRKNIIQNFEKSSNGLNKVFNQMLTDAQNIYFKVELKSITKDAEGKDSNKFLDKVVEKVEELKKNNYVAKSFREQTLRKIAASLIVAQSALDISKYSDKQVKKMKEDFDNNLSDDERRSFNNAINEYKTITNILQNRDFYLSKLKEIADKEAQPPANIELLKSEKEYYTKELANLNLTDEKVEQYKKSLEGRLKEENIRKYEEKLAKDTHLTPEQIEEYSKVANAKKLTPEQIEDYKNVISNLNNLANGNLSQSVIEQAIANSVCTYNAPADKKKEDIIKEKRESVTKKSLQNQLKQTKKQINGWHSVVDLIDSMGLSTENGAESERQQLINSLKDISDKKDIIETLKQYTSLYFEDKDIARYVGKLSYENLHEIGLDKDGKFDIKKLEKFLNTEIDKINQKTQVEAHCHNTVLGEATVDTELKNQKSKHNKPLKEPKYDNIYEMILDISGKEEKDLIEIVQKNPNISPEKIATSLGTNSKDYKKALKDVSTKGKSIKDQNALWLKQKELNDFENAGDEFKTCLNDIFEKDDFSSMKRFISSINDKKNSDHKINNKFVTKLNINTNKIEKLVKDGKIDDIKLGLNALNKSIDKKIEAISNDMQNEVDMLAINKDLIDKADKNLLADLTKLEQLDADTKEFKKKVDFLNSLAEKGIPKDVINSAFEAFANGDESFFSQKQVSIAKDGTMVIETLAALAGEDLVFSAKDTFLLKRLKINSKKLKDSKKRKEQLKIINDNIKKMQQEQKENINKNHNKAMKNQEKIKPFEKESRKEKNSGLKKLLDLFKKGKDKAEGKEKDWLKSSTIDDKAKDLTGIEKRPDIVKEEKEVVDDKILDDESERSAE